MNQSFLGDSYDLVKRFFCHELTVLGYGVLIEPMFTDNWNGKEDNFFRLVGATPTLISHPSSSRTALFFDPDTGINEKGGKQHVSFDRLAQETKEYELVFSFDQSFSRQAKASLVMQQKLAALQDRGCHAMYYDSHARFLFTSTRRIYLNELRLHLVGLGLPSERLVQRIAVAG